MQLKVIQGYEFFCPYCESGNEVAEWDTVCDHPSFGFKEVNCWYCHKKFILRVAIEVKFQTIQTAGTLQADSGKTDVTFLREEDAEQTV